MSKSPPPADAPTLLLPRGTEIRAGDAGLLSIRTPGNLVLQGSGRWAALESAGGSIRIEAGAEVEAETVTCADTCYVQGSLIAWRVAARAFVLDERARASVVLAEAEHTAVGKEARLAGSFASEEELFLLFSRFAGRFRALPFFRERERVRELAGGADGREGRPAPAVLPPPVPEPLVLARVLLTRALHERLAAPDGGGAGRILPELVRLLAEDDRETLAATWRVLFARLGQGSEALRRAHGLVAEALGESAPPGPR